MSLSWLEKVAQEHPKWISMTRKMGVIGYGATDVSEDLVQEMYLKLASYSRPEKVFRNGGLHYGYIEKVLYGVVMDFKKDNQKQPETLTELNPGLLEIKNDEQADSFDEFYHKTLDEMQHWNPYYVGLYHVWTHPEHKRTIRKLVEETGISSRTICKERKMIRQELTKIKETG